ncbi:membrane protein [Candidatus Thiomargarita nelsonii]|uniref:Membrane protein n=1 Tax=Candidatus Thiomargarita nelsonii TaxID=1003181 RepID=A0A176RX95_9GAMM|nr:membrane protein [Candidatus Thiomargarita nelsonii]
MLGKSMLIAAGFSTFAKLKAWHVQLYLKCLWIIHTYPFYWAHKPLCERFQSDVIRIGTMFVCRSCFMFYAGMIVSVLFCSLFPQQTMGVILFFVFSSILLPFSFPPWYKKLPRWARDTLRLIMGMTIVLCVYLIFFGHFLLGVFSAALLIIFWKVYLIFRQQQKRHDCDGCLEFHNNEICTGFSFQAQRIRKYEKQATQIVLKSGYVPKSIRRVLGSKQKK